MPNPKNKLDKKQQEIKHLDEATQAIVKRIDKNNNRLLVSGFLTLTFLLIIGITIFYQNYRLASATKNHIDCIIKQSETPLKPGYRAKYIDDLNNTCQIRFTK